MSYLNLVLRAIKPESNVNRVYEIQVAKGLFESWIVITAYGRHGGGTHQKIHSFYTLEETKVFINKALKKRSQATKRIGCNYILISRKSSDYFMEACPYPRFS